jgi:L-asparaginase II
VEPSALHHACSGAHVAPLLLSSHVGWPLTDYEHPDHPAQAAAMAALASVLQRSPAGMRRASDACALPTFGLPLRDIALAFARLASPERLADSDAALADALRRVRDAMRRHPELIDGRFLSVDTGLPTVVPRVVAKAGAEGARGWRSGNEVGLGRPAFSLRPAVGLQQAPGSLASVIA